MALLTLGVSGAWADSNFDERPNFVSLTFDRSESNVTVNVKDYNGSNIPGVTATLESTSFTAYMTGLATALSRTSNTVLAPTGTTNGYANAQNSYITYTFKIEGLSGFSYNYAALDVYAMNAIGNAQSNAGNTSRKWTFNVATGSTAAGATSFVNQADNDICTVSDSDGGLYHKLWAMGGSTKEATDVLYVVVTLTKTDTQGCYAGLGKVQLYNAVDVTYNVVDGSGTTLASATVNNVTDGTTPAVPSAISNAYCDYGSFYSNASLTGDAVTEITGATTLYVGFSTNGSCPVTFSTAESPVYYYLKIRDSYMFAETAEATYPSISADQLSTKGGAWAFIGNPYSFRMINKLVGTSKCLNRNTAVNSADANGTIFSTTSTTNWRMDSHYLGNGFRIYDPSTTTPAHIYTDNIKLIWLSWAGTSSDPDGGGRFVATAYTDDFTSQVTAHIKPYFDKYASDGEVYFGITRSTYDTYNSTYTSRLTSCTEDEYDDLYSNVMSGIKYPVTGYYRLKNRDTSNYLSYQNSPTSLSTTIAASVVYLASSSNGVFSILLQGDKYLQMPAGSTVAATTSSTPMAFTASIVEPGIVSLLGPDPSNGFQNFGVSGSSIVGQSGSATTAQWTVEDATTFTGTLTDANDNTGEGHSYASLCVPFAISGLSGASAYAPTLSGNMLNLGTSASTVAAGTPVILVGASDEGSYTATINTASAPVTAVATTNALSGTFTGTSLDCTAATGTTYVLGFDEDNDDRIGFYHVNNEAFALSANRAYLVPGGGESSVKGFAINFDTATGIGEVVNGKTVNVQCYDLSGRRVSQPTRGLYIVGGKKVAVK